MQLAGPLTLTARDMRPRLFDHSPGTGTYINIPRAAVNLK